MSGTILAINKNFIPIRLVTVYSAIGKMYCGLANGIFVDKENNIQQFNFEEWLDKSMYNIWPEDQKFIQSVRQPIAIPNTIIYTKYDRIPKVTLKLTRKAIYERDHYTCYICGKEFTEGHLTLDHVIPLSRGGKNSWENLATCCRQCNWNKGDKLLHELKLKTVFTPSKPSISNISRLKASIHNYKDEWKLFGLS
jgi:5-methylcytosine-specific restriction endonuclease McrA